jgi:hypothetical protein
MIRSLTPMTPQSSFMVVAPVAKDRLPAIRELLSGMNAKPGMADPLNSLVPFGAFENLHFARFVILDDQTTADVGLYGIERPEPPLYLAFLGDFDGDYDTFINELSRHAGEGLRRIFSLCDGFTASSDLTSWIRSREYRPAAYYCNWVGRTVKQCREEELLRRAIRDHLAASPGLADAPAAEVRADVRRFVAAEQASGRLPLTPAEPTPFVWRVRHAMYVVALVLFILLGIVTLPVTLIPLFIIALWLRHLEKTDPVYAPRPSPDWAKKLARIEDVSVTNQFNALGSIKPGLLRRVLLKTVLWIVNLTAAVIYTKGRLARVATIHFARWVYIDGSSRVFFASNYDGSLDSYMDDFINKVGFGLNAVFSNGIAYPRTKWLLFEGAKNEQLFKYVLRRHQLPTEVWYNAHEGLTAFDLERNSKIRRGLEAQNMPAGELAEWVTLL